MSETRICLVGSFVEWVPRERSGNPHHTHILLLLSICSVAVAEMIQKSCRAVGAGLDRANEEKGVQKRGVEMIAEWDLNSGSSVAIAAAERMAITGEIVVGIEITWAGEMDGQWASGEKLMEMIMSVSVLMAIVVGIVNNQKMIAATMAITGEIVVGIEIGFVGALWIYEGLRSVRW